MKKVFLGLGTNIGNRKDNLKMALDNLEEAGLKVKKVSSVYETEPIGVREQDWFHNMVAEVQTELSAEDLLLAVKEIEKKMGREATYHWGPRVIDIDLLLYDDLQLNKEVEPGMQLRLPHPELKNRAFVIQPLLEIEPNATLPGGQHVSDFLQYTKDQRIKRVGVLNG